MTSDQDRTNSDDPHRRPDHANEYTTRALTSQVLEGHKLNGPAAGATCAQCNRELTEGEEVVFIGYQRYQEFQWRVRKLYCQDCRPTAIQRPSFGMDEVLATAHLGTTMRADLQTGTKTLNHVVISDFSPAEYGE